MKKLAFIAMLLVSVLAYSAADNWCLIGTFQCNFGAPSLSKLSKEERAASLYKLKVADYQTAVKNGIFEAITANELIKRAKAYLAAQVPTEPDPTPEVCPEGTQGTYPNCTEIPKLPADPPLDMSTLKECAIKGGDGCWFNTQKERKFYLLSDNQWETKTDGSWGTSCLINTEAGFQSTDIKPEAAFSCFVVIDESVNPPTDQECRALGKVLNKEGTGCEDAPPPDDQMPPPKPDNFMPVIDFSAIPAPAIGSGTLDIRAARDIIAETVASGTENGGQFRIQCGYSNMLNDDPIVYPNQEGASHNHTFFGNTSVNYKTTPDELPFIGNSTCFGGIANRSSYWTPSLIDTRTNKPVKPKWALFYYKTGKPNTVVAPPKGLRMIAGTASAQAAQGGWLEIIRWTCNEVYAGRQESIPACSGQLSKLVAFPSCWDGKNLDAPDHKSHMAYSDNGKCPATHPVQLPDITMNVHYQVDDSRFMRLSSDNYPGGPGGFSGHADWMNGWDEKVLNQIVNGCLRARKDCHANLLGNGQVLFDAAAEPNAQREVLK